MIHCIFRSLLVQAEPAATLNIGISFTALVTGFFYFVLFFILIAAHICDINSWISVSAPGTVFNSFVVLFFLLTAAHICDINIWISVSAPGIVYPTFFFCFCDINIWISVSAPGTVFYFFVVLFFVLTAAHICDINIWISVSAPVTVFYFLRSWWHTFVPMISLTHLHVPNTITCD